jgi:hypothetical protein
MAHRSAKIIEHNGFGYATKIPEGVFQTPDEVFRGLAENDFAVSFPRMTQYDAKHMRPSSSALFIENESALAEVDLGFGPGGAFHAPEGQGRYFPKTAQVSLDRGVASHKAMLIP